ncbi:hypothetical protein VNO80_28791 [Phaseolus coccineus]|uniref:Uncharacterized protein n=1 Tax=Phaseolus coccineus TaxID=3886 RepID=A0AAN9QEB5_PHACN
MLEGFPLYWSAAAPRYQASHSPKDLEVVNSLIANKLDKMGTIFETPARVCSCSDLLTLKSILDTHNCHSLSDDHTYEGDDNALIMQSLAPSTFWPKISNGLDQMVNSTCTRAQCSIHLTKKLSKEKRGAIQEKEQRDKEAKTFKLRNRSEQETRSIPVKANQPNNRRGQGASNRSSKGTSQKNLSPGEGGFSRASALKTTFSSHHSWTYDLMCRRRSRREKLYAPPSLTVSESSLKGGRSECCQRHTEDTKSVPNPIFHFLLFGWCIGLCKQATVSEGEPKFKLEKQLMGGSSSHNCELFVNQGWLV